MPKNSSNFVAHQQINLSLDWAIFGLISINFIYIPLLYLGLKLTIFADVFDTKSYLRKSVLCKSLLGLNFGYLHLSYVVLVKNGIYEGGHVWKAPHWIRCWDSFKRLIIHFWTKSFLDLKWPSKIGSQVIFWVHFGRNAPPVFKLNKNESILLSLSLFGNTK